MAATSELNLVERLRFPLEVPSLGVHSLGHASGDPGVAAAFEGKLCEYLGPDGLLYPNRYRIAMVVKTLALGLLPCLGAETR